MLLKIQKGLKSIYWTNAAGFTAESYTMQLLAHFNTINGYCETLTEDMKNHYLHESCYRKTDFLPSVTWIDMFKNGLLVNIDNWTYHKAMTKFIRKYNVHGTSKKRNVFFAGSNGGSSGGTAISTSLIAMVNVKMVVMVEVLVVTAVVNLPAVVEMVRLYHGYLQACVL